MAEILFSGRHFQRDMILQSVRWYLAYALSYGDIEEIMQERGVDVDHSTIHRWVVHYSPQLAVRCRTKKRTPCGRGRLDESYIKVKGHWKYYYHAVGRHGETVVILLTIGCNGKPSLINFDQSGSNNAAINQYNAVASTRIRIPQCKY